MKKNSYLGGDIVKLTFSKIVVLLITMISSMLLSRFRSLDEYGTYSQLMMIVTIATSIISMGLPNSINYFLARTDSAIDRSRILSVYYTMNTLLGIILGIFLFIITPLCASYFSNPMINTFAYFLLIFPWTNIICSSIENILIVYNKSNYIVSYRILNSVSLILIILIVELFNWSFQMYMVLYLLIQFIFTMLVFILVNSLTNNFGIKFDFSLFRSMLTFSIPLGVATMVGTINVELDKLIIGRLMNTEQLAIYTNASKEMPVTVIASSITAVLLPQITRLLKYDEKEKAIELWKTAISLSYVFICIISAMLVVFAPEVITLLYSDKYLPGVSIFRVYSILLLLRCTYWGMILNSSGHTKFILYSSIGALVMNSILNFILFYQLGIIGPAIATVLSQLIMVILQLKMTGKSLERTAIQLLPWKNICLISFFNIIMAFIFYSAKELVGAFNFCNNYLIQAILLGVIWGIIYFASLFKWIKREWISLNSQGDKC